MESLYVCLFSTGHIKVGRSNEPVSRMGSHAGRLSCIGVELAQSWHQPCEGNAMSAEYALIRQCTTHAKRRFQNEWFEGLSFETVCEWAKQAADMELKEQPRASIGFGPRLREARVAAGLTQTQLGEGMGIDGEEVNKAAISNWESERNGPNLRQLRLLCERLTVSADHLLGIEVAA